MDFFGKNNQFFNNHNIENIDNFKDNDNLHQNSSFNTDSDKPNQIQISKRVKSIRQLKNIEKELVRLNYKEAILKGFGNSITDIQEYILSKAHIFVERIGLEYLKKSEELENRTWYSRLAKDQLAYVYAYRKSIDEIEQLQKELWIICEDSKTTHMGKIKAIRELHKLTVTSTLLLRDCHL